ncbi:hypothetical protein NHX12_028302 [Muraenolepis orangiensis]|uniref:Metalloproteinase n=1 Tax=Muraenolepis orangiensis TaxID=630683 RepID=A0A9Q0EFM5_9TELE|nr:hypothetical protein NHX12_028302 [Muraenolepis orangiensis]
MLGVGGSCQDTGRGMRVPEDVEQVENGLHPPLPPPPTVDTEVSVSAAPDGADQYEVVRPVRLHTLSRRHAEYSRPDTLRYALTVGGRDFHMHLRKTRELLSSDYSETFYNDDGQRVTSVPNDIDHCYYNGHIVNDSQSMVSISTCDGLRGFIRTAAQRYSIEPLTAGEDEGDHAVAVLGDLGGSRPPMTCGVTNTTWETDDIEPPTGRSRSRAGGPSLLQRQKYVELFLVADNLEYLKMKSDKKALRSRLFEMVNFLNMVYKPMNTFVALVGVEVWSNRDQISVTPPAGATLGAFTKWRNSDLIKRKKHDNAQLISGINFEGATVGLAYVGTLCSGHSSGVVQDHADRAIAIGATLAHEMGHNLGMNHDDSSVCACSGESCIMAGALSWVIPKSFSSCSTSNYEKFLNKRTPGCLLNKPDYRSLEAPAVCGNGFLERGEVCDCGSVEECTNRCCNATTCRLTESSQCAFGECCQDCRILPHSSECRHGRDECDLAEFCDGSSNVCPMDVFSVNGLPCDRARGYCFNGQCPQREDQCVKMYGPTAVEARQYCYKQNTRATYYAFCKRPSNEQFIPCQGEDVMCGKLFCHGGNDGPNYGRKVTFSDCKATFYGDFTTDYGQVDTGTRCAEGKVCSNNECVSLETAYRAINCSAKCPGHGVCNHRAECQCEPGWTPPGCSSKDASFNQLSTRPPPPPPPAGNRAKPSAPSYTSARQALRPVPPPKV